MSDLTPNTLVPPPSAPVAELPTQTIDPELPAVITEREAEQAANELNLRYFNPRKSKAMQKIGMFQVQQGVIHLGVGRLAVADEALEALLETAVEIAQDSSENTGDRVGALMAGKHLASALQESIQMVADFHQDKLLQNTNKPKRAFMSDQPIVPIQAQNVNINVVDNSRPPPQS